ncbi:phage tail protein [Hyunsoonleella rubra]|uniref:Phage tail protein n=1 Tax=Hyunsoonleella rubra TaxID=1737062 RepID=A0ABW5T8T2_9FLAO
MFAGNFAPRGWALCQGQLLPISNYQALFSILGTTYGGDGRTTFALPDLRGRAPIHAGTGPGLTPRRLGAKGGAEQVTLSTPQIPNHDHTATTTTQIAVSTDTGTELNADGNHLANHTNGYNATPTDDNELAGVSSSTTTTNTGGSQAHDNMQPSITINYIIALVGIFPSRS